MKKTILIIDGGGRGAALVAAYAKNPRVARILAVPGNDLMDLSLNIPMQTFQKLHTTSSKKILSICQREKVDLIDVAQDNAVEVGVSDLLRKNGFTVFGPSKKAGQIEWDKAWARKFGQKYNLPQPSLAVCKTFSDGEKYLRNKKDAIRWIKAAGLAQGKGAVKAETVVEAMQKIKELKEKFPLASKTYLIEDNLTGEEFSAFAITDGRTMQIIGFAQDHKRMNDGDRGENTGGMGCSTPPLVVSKTVAEQAEGIFEKTIAGLRKEKREYQGILYLGGMVDEKGKVYVVEFNARWGDPEAEVLLPGIENDWLEIALACAKGRLSNAQIRTDKKSRVVVAGVSKGYPGNYAKVKGKKIFGIQDVLKLPNIQFYSAGIKKINNEYLADGGRLFYLVGEGKNVTEARKKVYEAMKLISVEGNNLHYRTDIGFRDVERLKKS